MRPAEKMWSCTQNIQVQSCTAQKDRLLYPGERLQLGMNSWVDLDIPVRTAIIPVVKVGITTGVKGLYPLSSGGYPYIKVVLLREIRWNSQVLYCRIRAGSLCPISHRWWHVTGILRYLYNYFIVSARAALDDLLSHISCSRIHRRSSWYIRTIYLYYLALSVPWSWKYQCLMEQKAEALRQVWYLLKGSPDLGFYEAHLRCVVT